MPTDFESAKCEGCGKIYEPKFREDQNLKPGFIRIDDCLDYFNAAWKRSGIQDKQSYIKDVYDKQEAEFQRMSRKGLKEEVETPDNVQDYDPNSPEPRYLQMAKAELIRRQDLKCRDCGFTGLPAQVDGNCPECGGLMDPPQNQMTTAAATADQIRANIRQQALDQQQGLKKNSGTQEESVHASIPSHEHDIHLSDLVKHYGFRADGDHYVAYNDPKSVVYVESTGRWIHHHHGVHHEGHGHQALSAHMGRYGNHRSERG